MFFALVFISFLKFQDSYLLIQPSFIVVAAIFITESIYYLVKNYLSHHSLMEWIPLLCLPYTIIISFVLS